MHSLLSSNFSNLCGLNSAPSPYRRKAPATDAAVETRITPMTDISVQVVKKPPKVRISSDGMGGNTVSTTIKSPIPRYPN